MKKFNLVSVLVGLGYSELTARPSASKIGKMALLQDIPMDCLVDESQLKTIRKYMVEKSTSKFKDAWTSLDIGTLPEGNATVINKSNVALINEVLLAFSKWTKEQKVDAAILSVALEALKKDLKA